MIGSRRDAKKEVNEAKSVKLRDTSKGIQRNSEGSKKRLYAQIRDNTHRCQSNTNRRGSKKRRARKPLQNNKGSEWQE